MNFGKVFVIAGAAGSGKTTVAKYLHDRYKMERVITHATRASRPNERDGVDYHFETPASMNKLHLLESVEYDHHLYGSSLESLVAGWQTGHDNVIVLDTKGAFTYYQKLGDRAVIIFLTVSHIASLAHRMVKRGDELRAVHSRLKSPEYHRDLHLPDELKGIANVVVNDSWSQTTNQIDQIVRRISSEKD